MSTVSLRAAATALGVAKSTLSQLLRREPSLAAAVVGRGARGSLEIDLDLLRSAWGQLQGPEPSPVLSAKALYEAERRRLLWWQLQGLVGQLEDQASRLANAAELTAALDQEVADAIAIARTWAASTEVAAVAGQPQAQARIELQASIVSRQQEIADRGKVPSAPPPQPPSLAVPDPLPKFWELKAAIEATRAEQAELAHRLAVGELAEASVVSDRYVGIARQLRDGWRQAGEHVALQARRLDTPESVRKAALHALSAAGLS
ncbi:hypothetical protein KBY85_15345 [Cyanobium sp. BA5m-10]|uniref:hypothetical protein n=1 Tax=Cyanobium sp. BA5m-10 TaxID=2823705 RepID=UPI0020CDE143|nr:hypothetical protein [Cyanobium sp. BA5m-10]MCP9905499.1 hypothetical protein [Cyanobium sp. BA5m-10]